jgi:autotransporter-associated beta strand protein
MDVGDVATFGISNTVDVSNSTFTEFSSIIFEPGASPFTITATPLNNFQIDGGIVNDSGVAQNFRSAVDDTGNSGAIIFLGNATAGSNTIFTASARTAASGTTGDVEFVDFASADKGVFVNEGGEVNGSIGGQTRFFSKSHGGHAEITNNGGMVSGAGGGTTYFLNNSDAGNATLIANGGINGGGGGQILFSNTARAGRARIKVFGNGLLVLDPFRRTGLTVGSLEGDGMVTLGGFNLAVGGTNLSTAFSGTIEDGNYGPGSLTKIGSGTLTLSGANTYSRGTTVSAGELKLTNTTGSATGAERVKVEAGTLSGNGIVAGPVTVGTGTGSGAFIAPAGTNNQATLTFQSSLTFNSDATYTCTFKARKNKARTDLVIADGVTINGATLNLSVQTEGQLKPGLTLTLISNTSVNPISGTFGNLPDGAIVNVNGNNLQASYSGGDGNDLTLTVVP